LRIAIVFAIVVHLPDLPENHATAAEIQASGRPGNLRRIPSIRGMEAECATTVTILPPIAANSP